MITRLSIAFGDILGSSIASQVMPPWWGLTILHVIFLLLLAFILSGDIQILPELSLYGFNRPKECSVSRVASLSSKRDSFLFTSHITVFLKSCQASIWLVTSSTRKKEWLKVLMSSCTPGLSCLTFQTKEISEQECSLNFVSSKQGGNFSNQENIEIQRHHEAAICFIRYV